MCSRVGKTQINNHIHNNQNENHGLFGTTLTIQTRAIDIVMLNKNIPINQQTGATSHNNKNGRDNKRDETQTLSHHHLSANIQPRAFHISRHTTNHTVRIAQVFQE